jgi:hypothetical protein
VSLVGEKKMKVKTFIGLVTHGVMIVKYYKYYFLNELLLAKQQFFDCELHKNSISAIMWLPKEVNISRLISSEFKRTTRRC